MQHFIYQIKRILRKPAELFWAVAFPVLLGGLFYVMFGNLVEIEMFSEVPVGVVIGKENDRFLEMLKTVEMEAGISMFDVTEYKTEEDAEQALKMEEIQGYILVEGQEFEIVVKKSSLYSSLIKTFVDQYQQNAKLIEDVALLHPEKMEDLITALSGDSGIIMREIPLKGQDKDPYTQYFYALLAMACLIASSVGVQNGFNLQADLSPVGARRNVAPTGKVYQVFLDFAASLLIYCVLMTGVLSVLVFGYKRDFGGNIGLVLLATYVGSFTGLAAGYMIAVMMKGSKTAKEGAAVAFFMVSSFLGGLQWGGITYLLEKHCPVINRINPATLMVNAYKSLVVFGDTGKYAVNLMTLLLWGIIFLGISIGKLRRTRYASL